MAYRYELTPRERIGKAALRAAVAVGNGAVLESITQDCDRIIFGEEESTLTPDDLVTMAEVTAANAVAGTLYLDPDWVTSHNDPWAPEPATHELQTPRVRVLSSTMGSDQRLSGRAPSR